jgi:multidrug efflux pump subunit AcrA (membrane-fusion protein)
VKKLHVHYGDRVKEGQVLAELDRELLEASVRESRANLLAAEASWERNKIEAEGPDLPFLKLALERSRKLYADGLIAPSLLEDADKAYQMGLNKQTAAKSQASVSRAEVEKARATLERAQTDLNYATISSPMDGLVLSRDVEVGDAVSSILVLGSQATLVMTLGDVSEVYVLGKVDEADIGKVYIGQRARIVVESFKDKSFEGKVTKISPLGVEKDNVTDLRGARVDPESRRRAQDQHDRERRGDPRGEEGDPDGARVGGALRQGPQALARGARPEGEGRQAQGGGEARHLERRESRARRRPERRRQDSPSVTGHSSTPRGSGGCDAPPRTRK